MKKGNDVLSKVSYLTFYLRSNSVLTYIFVCGRSHSCLHVGNCSFPHVLLVGGEEFTKSMVGSSSKWFCGAQQSVWIAAAASAPRRRRQASRFRRRRCAAYCPTAHVCGGGGAIDVQESNSSQLSSAASVRAINTTPPAKDDHVHQLDNANATITVFGLLYSIVQYTTSYYILLYGRTLPRLVQPSRLCGAGRRFVPTMPPVDAASWMLENAGTMCNAIAICTKF